MIDIVFCFLPSIISAFVVVVGWCNGGKNICKQAIIVGIVAQAIWLFVLKGILASGV
jgi:hypothetical protein